MVVRIGGGIPGRHRPKVVVANSDVSVAPRCDAVGNAVIEVVEIIVVNVVVFYDSANGPSDIMKSAAINCDVCAVGDMDRLHGCLINFVA